MTRPSAPTTYGYANHPNATRQAEEMNGDYVSLETIRATLRNHGISIVRCKRDGKIRIHFNEEPELSDFAMRMALETADEGGYTTELAPQDANNHDGTESWTLILTPKA